MKRAVENNETMENTSEMKWKITASSNCGKRHEMKNMLSQDRYFIRSGEGKYIAVLADGIGKTNLNVVGTEMTAQLTAKYLEERFDWIMTEKPDVVAEDYMATIIEKLLEMAEEYKTPVKEFASTIMAFCVDETQDRYCLLHLGAGIILYRNPAGQMRVLSFPEVSLYSNLSTLTTTDGAAHKLKIMRGSAERISQLALMTDGMYETKKEPGDFERMLRDIEQNRPLEQEVDDKSVVMLYRTTENATD